MVSLFSRYLAVLNVHQNPIESYQGPYIFDREDYPVRMRVPQGRHIHDLNTALLYIDLNTSKQLCVHLCLSI